MADSNSYLGGISLFQKKSPQVKHLALSNQKSKKKMPSTLSTTSEIDETKTKLTKKQRKKLMAREGDLTNKNVSEQTKRTKKKMKDKVDIDFSDVVGNVKSDPSARFQGKGIWNPRDVSTDESNGNSNTGSHSHIRHKLKKRKMKVGSVCKTHKHGSSRLGQGSITQTDSIGRSESSEEEESDMKAKVKERTNKGQKRKRHKLEENSGTVSYKMKRRRESIEAEDSDSSEEDGSRDDVADTPEGPRLSLSKVDSDSEQEPSEDNADAGEHGGSVDKPKTWTSSGDDLDISEEDTSEEEEEEQKEEDKSEVDEYASIKQELSNMSFEDLQKIQEKLGMKVFNQLRHGRKVEERKQKRVFKRENKNRPMEISSKRPVGIIRSTGYTKKKMSRDPRFDDLSGQYNETYFKKSYSFLDEVKAREKEKVKKQLKKEKAPDKRRELQHLLNRMNQQETSMEQKERQKAMDKEFRQREKDLVKEGKTPFFLKKADKRKLELAEKFKELKKSGKVDKYLMKKRKKNAQKDRKKMPAKFDRFDL